MVFRRLAITLFFGALASLGYAAGSSGGADIQPLNEQPAMLNVFKDLNAVSSSNTSGSNPTTTRRIQSNVARTNSATSAPAASVPEPSATILLAIGLVGFALLKRRASIG
jgi:hypothetical protein